MSTYSLLNSDHRDLIRFQLPLTACEGITYLQKFNRQVALIALYKHYFPIEWSASTVDLWYCSNQNSLYSDREIEFLTLVDERLFPIDNFIDFFEEEELHLQIPIYPHNINWYELCSEDLNFSEQFIMSLIGCGHSVEDWLSAFGFTPDKLFLSEDINWQLLSELCQQQIEPLSFLYDVISLIDHSTGCIWLDTSFEEYITLPWCQESVDLLTHEWKIAQEYHVKTRQFDEWLDNSTQNCQKVLNLWNQACTQ